MSRTPNNFAKRKPTVVLHVPNSDMDKAQKLVDENGHTKVFKNFAKAAKHVSRFIDPSMHRDIQYVNETPVEGEGDREETNYRRCLRCNGFLRPSDTETSIADGVVVETFVCDNCD